MKRPIVYDAEHDESIELTDEEVKRFYPTKDLYKPKPKTGEETIFFPDFNSNTFE
jgi:NOL1/NOP2/fmu family ribosome biogenesis protein